MIDSCNYKSHAGRGQHNLNASVVKEDYESLSSGRQLCWGRMTFLLEDHSSLALALIKNLPEQHALLEGMTLLR